MADFNKPIVREMLPLMAGAGAEAEDGAGPGAEAGDGAGDGAEAAPPQADARTRDLLMNIAVFVWYVRPLRGNGSQLLGAVQAAIRDLMKSVPEYPVLVLPPPAARLYQDAIDSGMSLQAKYNIFEYIILDAMLTWADLRCAGSELRDEELAQLHHAIDNLMESAALIPPPGYLECSRGYVTALLLGGAAVLPLLPERRWRLTLAQMRAGQPVADAGCLLEDYLSHCRRSAGAVSLSRCSGYASLIGAAQLSPCEQQRLDLLDTVLRRLEGFEMGILIQLAARCELRYLGFLLYYALSQAAEPRPVSHSTGCWPWLKGQLARCLDRDASWQRAVMVPRECVLVVDSMPGLAPTRRCLRFLSFTEAPSLSCLPSRNVCLAACASDPAARRRIGADDGVVLNVFRQQLGARSIGAVVCFIDQAMLARLEAGDQFVAQVLDAILAKQTGAAEPRLPVAWCLEASSPCALRRGKYQAVPADSVFPFGGLRKSWRVWRSVLQLLDGIPYTRAAAVAL